MGALLRCSAVISIVCLAYACTEDHPVDGHNGPGTASDPSMAADSDAGALPGDDSTSDDNGSSGEADTIGTAGGPGNEEGGSSDSGDEVPRETPGDDPDVVDCSERECGPAPGAPNVLCDDGSVAGPACERNAAGECGWVFRECGEEDDPGAEACSLECKEGTHCELVQVVCVTEPCDPVPECVPDDVDGDDDVFCGGFAALRCPGEGECVDDPDDDCAADNGGRDCGGVCVCEARECRPGRTFNDDPAVCACERDGLPGISCANVLCQEGTTCVETPNGPDCVPVDSAVKCGDNLCTDGQVCCNASCGVCTEPGGGCTQQICD